MLVLDVSVTVLVLDVSVTVVTLDVSDRITFLSATSVCLELRNSKEVDTVAKRLDI